MLCERCHEGRIVRSTLPTVCSIYLYPHSIDISRYQSSSECVEHERREILLMVRAGTIVSAPKKQRTRIQLRSKQHGLKHVGYSDPCENLTIFQNLKLKTSSFLSTFSVVKTMINLVLSLTFPPFELSNNDAQCTLICYFCPTTKLENITVPSPT